MKYQEPVKSELGEEAARAAKAFETLTPEQQRVLRLSVYEGLSHELIARSTGLPLGTVKTHARRGLESWELGSVAEQVIHKSPCPVLTVTPGSRPAATAGAPPFRSLLCAVDLGPSSDATLEYALSMGLRAGAKVAVVHAMEDIPVDVRRMELRLGGPWFAAYRETVERQARTRVPEADLRLGDMQALPFADDAFDLVTGFTSFFYADDPVAAVREAGRVSRGRVVVHTFGHRERCDALTDASWRPEIVDEVVPQAGLAVERSFYISWSYADGVANEWHIVVATASSPAH